MPQNSTHAVYDSIYLETGFNSIEGPSLKEMEQRKVVVMQQMNHVLAQKALDGFFVAACDCGVNHRDGPDGMQHNLFYHILLKKVSIAKHCMDMFVLLAMQTLVTCYHTKAKRARHIKDTGARKHRLNPDTVTNVCVCARCLWSQVMPVPPGMPPQGMHHALAHLQQQQQAAGQNMGQGLNMAPINQSGQGRPW